MEFFLLFFKKFLRYILKPLSFLPALCMMYLIFSFSAQTGTESGSLSYQVSKILVLAYNRTNSSLCKKIGPRNRIFPVSCQCISAIICLPP